MFFDITVVEQNLTYFFDTGTVQGINNIQAQWPNLVYYTATNFFIGCTNFSITSSADPQFTINLSNSFNIASTSGYSLLEFDYLNFRVRSCVLPNIYYR
jgi:hypothetical protein